MPPFSGQFRIDFERQIYAWNPIDLFGVEKYSPAGMHYYIFLYSLSLLGIDGDVLCKFVSIFFMILAGYFMFYLCKRMRLSTPSSLLSGIFYMISPPTVFNELANGHPGVVMACSLIPLTLAFFMDSLEGKHTFKNLLLAGIVATFATGHPAYFITLSFTFLLYCFVHGLCKRNIRAFVSNMKKAMLVMGIPFLLNAHYLTVGHFVFYYAISAFFAALPLRIFLHGGYDLLDTLILLGFFMHSTFEAAIMGAGPFWLSAALLLVILAFSAIILKPKDERVIFSGVLAVTGISLVSGVNGPLGPAWLWFAETVPVFRDPAKWNPTISLGYAILLGVFSEAILNAIGKLKEFRFSIYRQTRVVADIKLSKVKITLISLLFVFLLGGSIFVYASPFLSGDIAGHMQTYEFDEKYKELWRRFSNDPEDYRVLTLPAHYPTQYVDQKRYVYAYDPMSLYVGKPVLYSGVYAPRFVTFLFKTLYENRTEHLADLLGLANIKYIVFDLNKRTMKTDVHWVKSYFPEMVFTNEKLLNTLSQQEAIRLHEAKDSILIFNNTEYIPHISSFSQIGLLAGDLRSLVSLSYMENLSLKEIGLIFVDQLSAEELSHVSLFPNLKVIIQDGHYLDLVLATASDKQILKSIDYYSSSSPTEGWTPNIWSWYHWYYQASLEYSVFTWVPSDLNVPFSVHKNGEYEVYVKLYFGPRASEIDVYLDDSKIGHVVTKAPDERGFKWIHFGSIRLSQEEHKLRIKSTGGEEAVASIAIVPKHAIEDANKVVRKLIEGKQLIVVSKVNLPPPSIDESPLFKLLWDEDVEGSWTTTQGGQGNVGVPLITSEKTYVKSGNGSLKLTVPANGSYAWAAIDLDFSPAEDWSEYAVLSLWWYGQNTNGTLSIRLEDSAKRAQGWSFTENWNGWKRIIVPLRKPDVSYGSLDLSSVVKLRIGKAEAGTWYLDRVGLDVAPAELTKIGVSASEGTAVSSIYTPVNQSFYVPKEGFYKIYVRGAGGASISNMSVQANGFQSNILLRPLAEGFQWYDFGEMYLPNGLFTIIFHPNGDRIYFDQLIIMESLRSPETLTGHTRLVAQKINPTKYLISANASKPFYIFFSERHHDSWKVYLEDGTQIRSYPAYSFGNLFFINKTGNLNMTLEFEKQRLYDVDIYISFASFIVMILLLLLPTRLFRFSIKEKRTS